MPESAAGLRAGPTAGGQPRLREYALIGDCHSAALVSLAGSIDWCCVPRMNSPSCFARLLDWEGGGYCSATVSGAESVHRTYVGQTMVLTTTFNTPSGEGSVTDCFTMRQGGRHAPHHQLLRIFDGIRGETAFDLRIAPRFDYGEVRPWVRRQADNVYAAMGGSHGLLISCDSNLAIADRHDLHGEIHVTAGQRIRLSIQFSRPELLDESMLAPINPEEIDARLEETLEWWRHWAAQGVNSGPDPNATLRSCLVLKTLTYAPTGAMAAAPTTSLPEVVGGGANWDYRYSWIRDSVMAVTSLGQVGFHHEADGFRRFIQRSAAGSAADLQILYGLGGERHMPEVELSRLPGYREARPVRIGNAASTQLQLDTFGNLADLVWLAQRRGHSPDDDGWRFLVDIVDNAAARWHEPDKGIWEIRGAARHFVHSKVMCWVALDRGIRLAKECMRQAPIERWAKALREVRTAVEEHGYDKRRGVFVSAFGSRAMDASLLLLPTTGFVDYDDARMVRTVKCIQEELETDGLLIRYKDRSRRVGSVRGEGAFLACTFWLSEVLVHQGQLDEAREVFYRAAASSNELGLFAEEFDPRTGEMLGNFPQALTHMAHIRAGVTLVSAEL